MNFQTRTTPVQMPTLVRTALADQPLVVDHRRRAGADDERHLQQRAADELEVLDVELAPARAPLFRVGAESAKPDGAELQGERAQGVEDQIEDAADDGDQHPVDMQVGDRTSHAVARILVLPGGIRPVWGDWGRSRIVPPRNASCNASFDG